MSNKKTKSKFNVGDIVTFSKECKELLSIDFAQQQFQVYEVMSINDDKTISLAGVWPDIPAQYIEGVPIHSELAKQIYYDTVHTRHYVPGKVYLQEDICSRPPFMVTMEERLRNTPLWEEMQEEEFHFVHELQHWLTERIGYSKIHINTFWSK